MIDSEQVLWRKDEKYKIEKYMKLVFIKGVYLSVPFV